MATGEPRRAKPVEKGELRRGRLSAAQCRNSAVEVRRVPFPECLAWPAELAALLGKMSDRQVARKTGVSSSTVAIERKRRGIAAYRPKRSPIDWTPDMIALLGTASDKTVARFLGIPCHCIVDKRRILRIPGFYSSGRHREQGFSWAAEAISFLGQKPDWKIAEQLGISTSTVMRKRRRLGIRAFKPQSRRIKWTDEMLGLLGEITDTEMADRYSISEAAVEGRRKRLGIPAFVFRKGGRVVATPALIALLHLPGSEVRRQTGLSWQTIYKLRREHGIIAQTLGEWRWSPEILARMGREQDARIAQDIGYSPGRVAAKRKELGIPAFRKHRRTRRLQRTANAAR